MPQEFRNQVPAARGRATLPDRFYYLNNFQTVLSSIEERYAQLLSSEERHFIVRFRALPGASRALLVRMVTRSGTMFRRSRLNYPEIGDTSAAAEPLVQMGWVNEAPDLDVEQLRVLLTKAELLDNFPMLRPHRSLKKPELVAILRTQSLRSQPFEVWCERSSDRVYHLFVAPLCERLRLMFFGNFRQDWSEFVLADLGVYAYEKVPAALQSPAFRSRAHIDTFEQLYHCRQQLDGGIALAVVAAGMPPPIEDCDWLEDRRQKLLFQIARAHEKSGDPNSALAVFAACAYRGARMRRIRLHERARAWAIARDLCLEALQKPENEAERQQLHRVLPRLDRNLGVVSVMSNEPRPVPSFELVVNAPNPDCAVELRARERLARDGEGTTVHYVENGLVNALFGLLCWKALFAPISGAFFHDFQYAPADLSSGQFYRRRRREFAGCFAELESDQYKTTIYRYYADKAGIQCAFVDWGLLSKSLLDCALTCFPPAHLKLWFEWIVSDIRENRAGFPDLVQFWPQDRRYRMIEVKGPGDRLQDNQRRLLEYCLAHHMPVAVCNVRWSDS
jgi:VRR-NUC domain/Fanconi anemia-associated nuclease SAP domain